MPLISSLGLMNAVGFMLPSAKQTTIAVAHGSSPVISTYPWSAGFGTKYANPSTLPTNSGFSVSFSI